MDLPLSGRVTASASLDGSFDSLLAAGTVDSPALTVKGYEIDNLHLPLSAQGTQVNVTDGTFYLAGGKGTLTIRRTALLLRRLKARVLIWERWPLM